MMRLWKSATCSWNALAIFTGGRANGYRLMSFQFVRGIFVPAELSRQLVLTTTYDLTDERTASARLVCSDSNTNVYAAYRQRVRRGMDLLIVVGDPNADQWVSRLAVKAMWCF